MRNPPLLTGSVPDPSGDAVQGAQITWTTSQTRVKYSSLTDAEGLFGFPDLPIGTDELSAAAPATQTMNDSGGQPTSFEVQDRGRIGAFLRDQAMDVVTHSRAGARWRSQPPVTAIVL